MAKRSKDIRQLVVFSDTHCGSRRSLMPSEYTLFEEGTDPNKGMTIRASATQRWLYDCWRRGWDKVLKHVGRDPWAWACIGDAIEGAHHGRTELLSNDPTDHIEIFKQCNAPYAAEADKRFFVRGTQCHTGDTMEMKIAQALDCEQHPDTRQYAADRWLLDINGFKVLLRHHMGVTSREYTRTTAFANEHGNEIIAAQLHGQPSPDGCVFAHRHCYDYWHTTRSFVLVCGPWQQTTRHGHTKWSPMLPEPTITVLDWRDSPQGGLPVETTFQFTPPAAKVFRI